jgi:outer membrane receptor protein involved in Fe transport
MKSVISTWGAVLALILVLPTLLRAEPGNITGKVLDSRTKDPLPFSNVVVVGTPYGAMSMEDGSYFIRNVPEGTYTVKASYMGYEAAEQVDVAVRPFTTAEVDFKLLKTVLRTTEEVLVTAERPMVEVDVPSTVRSVTEEELRDMPVTNVEDIVSLQAGVIRSDDEIHIRGGRTDETLYIIDGVRMKDLLSGKSSLLDVSARSVAEMDVITGGYSAEYGQALSGIVNVKIKEGGSKNHGYIEHSLDHMPFRETSLDYFNTDRFEVGIDGPEPITSNLLRKWGINVPGQVTYYLGLSARFSDTHLPSINDLPGQNGLTSSYQDNFLGIKFDYKDLAPRAENRWQLFGKTVWRPSSNNKFGLSFTKTIAIDQGYYRYDPYDVTRELTGFQYEWSKNLDAALVYTEDTNTLAFTWNQILSANSFHILRLSRFFNCVHANVRGGHWSDTTYYSEPDDADKITDRSKDLPYFIQTGSADMWHDRYTETYTLGWDLTTRFPPHHQVKTGIDASYENAQYIIIRRPWVEDPDGLGEFHDLFHIYPNRGAVYIQDKINFEGLIGNLGLRYDYWFPGKQVERAVADTTKTAITQTTRENFYRDTHEIFGRRFKGHVSPRIAISHPITDRDNLFFNYGHFSQFPTYLWVYSKLSSVSSERFPLIGNPNLNPEISVQYEIGARHQFSETIAGNFTLFYKDIYDYPKSTPFEIPGVGELFIYRNLDYGRSRGIEIEIKKKRKGLIGGSLVYTYSIATGKSSDPNTLKLVQEQGGSIGTAEQSLAEEYLWWNKPHKLNIYVDLRVQKDEQRRLLGLRLPSDWALTFQWLIQSGKAYTPRQDGQKIGKEYSENAEAENELDMKFTKYFAIGNAKAKVTLEVKNVFNDRTVRRIDPETGEVPRPGVGGYVEDAGTLYGAIKHSDPSYYEAPRRARLGMGIEW